MVTIPAIPGCSGSPSCSTRPATARRRPPAITDEQLREILNNLDISDIELSEDEDDLAGTAPMNVSGENEDSPSSNDELSATDEETSDPPASRRVFWRLNADFGEPAQRLLEMGVSTGRVELQKVLPLEMFLRYVSGDLLAVIATCTNQRLAEQGKTPNVTPGDIFKFFGICFYTSVIKFPWLRMYWSEKYRLPVVADQMSRNKFFNIRANLKVVDDNRVSEDHKQNDRLWKIRPLLDAIRQRCLQLDRPEAVAVDEQMIPFTGTTSLKHYVPNKPNPVGLKNWVLAGDNGLMLDFEIDQGKSKLISMLTDARPGVGLGEAVVLRLSETLPVESKVYFDRFFTSLPLLDALSDRNLKATGTIMKNRIPKPVKIPTQKDLGTRGTSQCSVRQDPAKGPLGITTWLDNKPVILASNHEGIHPEDECRRWSKRDRKFIAVSRPAVVRLYNRSMGGVDLLDRMVSYYRTSARTKKWTVRVILHMLDVTATNCWIEYKNELERTGHGERKDMLQMMDFKLRLAEQLIEEGSRLDRDMDRTMPEDADNTAALHEAETSRALVFLFLP
ncbi:piggyBac transposable element-derived protein 3-like [Amphibalanus amphitrite]|uniref:piggyBac transposable element-derived protein 3-like n=1 Tax=Amphibalanus amphitrite TaxID=1232801 RepID=UPI001C90E800|nr:piggyBac transposable element-derived protein 3-like [Amphibalanus amphitrite]